MESHLPPKTLRTSEISSLARVTRASGAAAAAKAMAPQARTEKTVEKRILTERMRMGVLELELRAGEECRRGELRLRVSMQNKIRFLYLVCPA